MLHSHVIGQYSPLHVHTKWLYFSLLAKNLSDRPLCRCLILLITRVITYKFGLHLVLLPLLTICL